MEKTDHRVRVTKRLLRDALTVLLTEKPLGSITVKELCLRAGINRGTFYAHYADVYDLLRSIQQEMETDFFDACRPVLTSAGQMPPPKVTKTIFECIEANADLCRATIGPHGDKEFARNLLRKCRELSMDSYRRFYPDATEKQIETYYTFVSGGCIALMERWIRGGMNESSAVLAEAAERIMESGVSFLK
ncbi:MAG: TetR/AcrR family transcriptional regulator [Clostridia bacterium]|nr:TetR/AcrR family transcriptional regulator [Clostridia bacterium]